VIQRWLPQATEKLPNSPKQMKELFDSVGPETGDRPEDEAPNLRQRGVYSHGAKAFPKYKEMLWAIMEWRTLDKMRSNFIEAKLDPDGRMRSSLNTAGPETFRWSSSKNPWGRGTNLQNVAKPFHNLTGTRLPNLRRSIVPTEGSLLWEPDLKGADAQIVAWDAATRQ
jgi:DNA polymerase I-like protein with 3'-5' exonuclease and polymerase domains